MALLLLSEFKDRVWSLSLWSVMLQSVWKKPEGFSESWGNLCYLIAFSDSLSRVIYCPSCRLLCVEEQALEYMEWVTPGLRVSGKWRGSCYLLVIWGRVLNSDGSLTQIELVGSWVNEISKECLKYYFTLMLFSELSCLL